MSLVLTAPAGLSSRWSHAMAGGLLAACGLVVLLVPALGCPGRKGARGPDGGGAAPSGAIVRRADFRGRFLLTGELKAVRSTDLVVPRTPSWQIQIRWMETDGATVQAGQKVLEFDNSSFTGELEEKRLAEAQAENALLAQEAQAAAAEAENRYQLAQRQSDLEKAKIDAAVPAELRPQRDHQEKQLALHRAQAQYENARETLDAQRRGAREEREVLRIQLEKATREVRIAEQSIGALVLTAPRGGILVVNDHPWEGRKLQVGDSAWVGLAVMSIPDLAEMEVDAMLVDVDDGIIAVGMPAVCTLDTYPDQSFPGVVKEITPIAQAMGRRSQRRAFRAVIDLERSDPERMRPGMSVKVEITTRTLAGVLLAPRSSLDLDVSPPRALLPDGGSVEVTLGLCGALECVVEDGVGEGTLLRSRL